jgi:hypothetical protein
MADITEPDGRTSDTGSSNKSRHTRTTRTSGGKGVHRRRFLGGMAGVALGAVAGAGGAFSLLTEAGKNRASAATNTATLTVPDLLEGTASGSTTTFTL